MEGLDLNALYHRDHVGSYVDAAGVELVGGQLAAGLQVDADVARSERPLERRQRFAAYATPLKGRCDKHLSYVQHPPCAKRSPAPITKPTQVPA